MRWRCWAALVLGCASSKALRGARLFSPPQLSQESFQGTLSREGRYQRGLLPLGPVATGVRDRGWPHTTCSPVCTASSPVLLGHSTAWWPHKGPYQNTALRAWLWNLGFGKDPHVTLVQSLTPGPLWHQALPAACQSLLNTTECRHPTPSDKNHRVVPSVQLTEPLFKTQIWFHLMAEYLQCTQNRTVSICLFYSTAQALRETLSEYLWSPYCTLVSCKNMSPFVNTSMAEKTRTQVIAGQIGQHFSNCPTYSELCGDPGQGFWYVHLPHSCHCVSSLQIMCFCKCHLFWFSGKSKCKGRNGSSLLPSWVQPPQPGRHQYC